MQQLCSTKTLDCSFCSDRFLCIQKVQNLSDLTKSNTQIFSAHSKTWLEFPFYMWRSLDETLNVFMDQFKILQKTVPGIFDQSSKAELHFLFLQSVGLEQLNLETTTFKHCLKTQTRHVLFSVCQHNTNVILNIQT